MELQMYDSFIVQFSIIAQKCILCRDHRDQKKKLILQDKVSDLLDKIVDRARDSYEYDLITEEEFNWIVNMSKRMVNNCTACNQCGFACIHEMLAEWGKEEARYLVDEEKHGNVLPLRKRQNE